MITTYGVWVARPGGWRKRYAKAGFGVAGAAVLMATGYAFLATNGNATTSISAPSGSGQYAGVYAATSGGAFPTLTVPTSTNTYVKAPTAWETGSTAAVTAGMWTPVLNQPTQVTQAGDIAVVNTTGATANVLVTLTVTNPASLNSDYSYVNIPVGVKEWSLSPNLTPTSSTTGAWDAAKDAAGNPLPAGSTAPGPTYLTFSDATVPFLLKPGGWYELYIPNNTPTTTDAAGSFYTVSTSPTASLSPNFYVNTQPA